jgi:hypothetical protein
VVSSALPGAGPAARAESFIWMDGDGLTHVTDDPEAVPREVRESGSSDVDFVRSLWSDGIAGPVLATPPGTTGSDHDRLTRLLRGAVEDLAKGENSRAAATLLSVIRSDPTRAEAYWYLSFLDRGRGRYRRSEAHMRAFLAHSGEELAPWRESARRHLELLQDERRLTDESIQRGPLRLVALDSSHFRLQMDAELSGGRADYVATVMRYLEDARRDVSGQLGVTPLEPLGVVFYGKAAYDREHQHRFSFQTVGFFDGRIHVASPAHPASGLRSLLYHEYTHALFREQTGGDRPYWLNEGLAERIERLSRRQATSTRSERAVLRNRLELGEWIALRVLGPGFSGLVDEDARVAYLESLIAVQWIEERTDAEQRARLLRRLGQGFSCDQALHEILGVDSDGLDRAIREEIRSEFPSLASPSSR